MTQTKITILFFYEPKDTSGGADTADGADTATGGSVAAGVRKKRASGSSANQPGTDLYINSYFDTENKILTKDKFCTNENCKNVVKNFDGSNWQFFDDMKVDFQMEEKCIKLTKNNTLAVTGCEKGIHAMVCRLDCCKYFIKKLK